MLFWFLTQSLHISYLLTKLSVGTHNDCDGPFSCLQFLLVHDVNQHGPDKSCCFATASFCNANHVTSRQSYGHTLKPRVRRKTITVFCEFLRVKVQILSCWNLKENLHRTWHWIGVGWVYSDLRIWCISCSSKVKWAKLVQGFGGAAPDTWKRHKKRIRNQKTFNTVIMRTTTVSTWWRLMSTKPPQLEMFLKIRFGHKWVNEWIRVTAPTTCVILVLSHLFIVCMNPRLTLKFSFCLSSNTWVPVRLLSSSCSL